MRSSAAVLIFLTTVPGFGGSVKIIAGRSYCRVFDIPSWGGSGEAQLLHETPTLEFRQQDSDHLLYAAARFSSGLVTSYGAHTYSLGATSGKATLLTDTQWQTATLISHYIDRGRSWPVSSETSVSYAGRTFPRTGKYWADIGVGPGSLIAISSWTGKPTNDDDLMFIPVLALPFLLPSMITDANRPSHWFAEIYDAGNGQKLASISANSRGLGAHWGSYWLSSGQVVGEDGPSKRLVVCDFRTKPH